MPTEETWPGFFKLHGAKSFEMDEKYVCRLRDRFKKCGSCASSCLSLLLLESTDGKRCGRPFPHVRTASLPTLSTCSRSS